MRAPCKERGKQGEDKIGGEREQDGRQRAEQHQIDGVLPDALKNEAAESAGADQSGDDGQADRLHGDNAQPGQKRGMPSGNSIRQRICAGVSPMPRAASITPGSIPAMPASVLRATGNSE